VLLFVIYGDADKEAEAAVVAALFFYTAFVMAFRYANFYKHESRWKVALETWAMIAFITWVCLYTGGLASPLLNTYMLPVIASALTLVSPGAERGLNRSNGVPMSSSLPSRLISVRSTVEPLEWRDCAAT